MRELQAGSAATTPDNYCGSCYGASQDTGKCCNTCAELKAAYAERRWGFPDPSNFEQCRREARQRRQLQEGEDCTIYGTMEVARVTGTFAIAPVSRLPSAKLQRLAAAVGADLRVQRHAPDQAPLLRHRLPRPAQPARRHLAAPPAGAAVSRYFLKVVPTTYEFVGGQSVHTNQFSVTQYFKPLGGDATASMVPAVNFVFELTPLKVKKTERRAGSFFSFVTRCAALIGGLFTVAGILDSILYTSTRQLEKLNMGKQG